MKSDIYVYLRGGTYNITETITFGPQDSEQTDIGFTIWRIPEKRLY